MRLEDQFCTKEQALRLVDLGVKPEALFWHTRAKSEKHGESIVYGWTSEAITPAYGVAELGDILPKATSNNRLWFTSSNGFPSIYWESYYKGRWVGSWPTEATARAGLLIYLLEEQLMGLMSDWRQNPDDAAEVMKVKTAKEAM